MHKTKSPGGNQGKGKKSSEQVASLYPAASSPVNGKCRSCLYFRLIPNVKLNRVFCALTGEKIAEGWSCSFWEQAGEGGGI